MTTVLYMATSVDGYIAGAHDETPWSDESWESFSEFVKTCDAVLVGRRTYEIMKAQDEFVVGPEYVVVTNNRSFDNGELRKISITTKSDLPQVEKLGIIGGGELNGSLAELSVIDEMILDVEPVTLGGGKRLFGSHSVHLDLELIETRQLGSGTVQNHYRVK